MPASELNKATAPIHRPAGHRRKWMEKANVSASFFQGQDDRF
jgi:hypothetical protein